VIYEGRRPGDPPELVASPEKARRLLGWEPRHADLDSIISSAWEFHLARMEVGTA
jgi:UDP-glucose 4-epimerase